MGGGGTTTTTATKMGGRVAPSSLGGARGVVARGEVLRVAVVGAPVEAGAGGGREEETAARRVALAGAPDLLVHAAALVAAAAAAAEAEGLEGQRAAAGQAAVEAGPGRAQHGFGFAEVGFERGSLDAAVERPGDEAAPGEDAESEEAEDGADADEDGALGKGGFLHEGCARGVGDDHRRDSSTGDGRAGAGNGEEGSAIGIGRGKRGCRGYSQGGSGCG